MRLRRELVDGWLLSPDRDAPPVIAPTEFEPPKDRWRTVRVPGYWQVQFPELARATGPVWYRLTIDLDHEWLDRGGIFVEFGAVSHFCQGWLNGQYLGEHEGGHLPFSWTLGTAAQLGTNELHLRVVSPSGDRSRYLDFPFEETLHGKQSWYGSGGGIWQTPAIEARSTWAVDRLYLQPDADNGRVDVSVDLAADSPAAEVCVEVLDPDEVVVLSQHGVVPSTVVSLQLGPDVRFWSPSSPALYRLRARVVVGGETVDRVDKRFGFRSFVADAGRFVLNGEPLLLRGVLDQDYFDGPGVPSDKQQLLERFALVKKMGFNSVRCHIKIPDPRYLEAADEIGILVWCELPTTSRLTHQARSRIEHALDGMVERDRHHPSIVIWGIANEAWGFDLVGNAEHRSWLHQLYRRMKATVSDRLIVDNSPCTPNYHIETDIEDYHFYAVIPEMRERWNAFLAAFTGRADFTFSPHGDARRTGSEPLVVSEFGTWGLPDLSHLEADEPWWFESGQEWADGAAYVHGAQQRFGLWHLDKVFGDWERLCLETQRRQFDTMRFQIETMRLRPEIAGYVLTELSDVHWEANGLLDMSGRPRSFTGQLPALNGSPALIAQADRPAVWNGDDITFELTVINDDKPKSELRLHHRVSGGSAQLAGAVEGLGARETHGFDPFTVTAGGDAHPTLVDVECSVVARGELVVSTSKPVLVMPDNGPQIGRDQPLVVGDDELAQRLAALGYDVTGQTAYSHLRVLRQLDEDDHMFIKQGGRCLLLAEDADALGRGFSEFPKIHLRAWDEALFGGGEWVSAFSWLRRTDRFAGLPGGPLIDGSFQSLAPSVVIAGIPPARYEYDVWSGVFVGWVHQVAGLIARHNSGLGNVLISTLRLTGQPAGVDPVADWLLHQLIATAWEQH